MLLATISLLSLAASVWAGVYPPTGNSFYIHPRGLPELCVGVDPPDYAKVDDFKNPSHLGWPLIKLFRCSAHYSQQWEWLELNGKKVLRNPGQLDQWVDPPSPNGMVMQLFQYRFPVTIGSTFSLQWLGWEPENYVNPKAEWTYTADFKLVNGWGGGSACMNYSVGYDGNGEIHIASCRDNFKYQQWQLEPIK